MGVPQHNVSLPFPINGIDRASASYDIGEGYALDCMNVRPQDPISRKLVGAKRPGTVKWSTQQLGGGAPIILLLAAQFAENPSGDDVVGFTDSFNYS